MIIRILSCLMLLHTLAAAAPVVEELSLEEKVGQLLMVNFYGEEANENAQQLIEKAFVGGIIYYNWANGLTSPLQVQRLSNGLQTLARKRPHAIPLLIAVDQEGGPVNRLVQGFTRFPGNQALGSMGDPELAKQCAYAMGQELLAVGVNMNLAPVVDIASVEKSVMSRRAYGSTAEKVVEFGRKAIQGYAQAGIIATLKHFPGYGEAVVDPHAELPSVRKTREELNSMELVPFRTLAGQVDAIMTAHILLPLVDPHYCATLSPTIVFGILRSEIGFKGVIISDSLIMRGVSSKSENIAEVAIQAFLAGHDILLLGGKLLHEESNNELSIQNVFEVHSKLAAAVRSGRISEERLNASVKRILALKQAYHLFD